MKINEIKEMVERVVRTEYVAGDGAVFYDREECKKYEDSALCVVSSKLKRLHRGQLSQSELFDFGFDDDIIEIFDVQTEEDLDNLRKYLYLNLIKYNKDEDVKKCLTAPEKPDTIRDTALYNITAGHEVIILWNYERDYAWTYGDGSLNGYFDHMRRNYKLITTPEEVKEKEDK